jgi:sugar phosphate isomerase/epimerase
MQEPEHAERHPLALDFSTCIELAPVELIEVAGANGCKFVSLLVQPYAGLPDIGLLGDPSARRDTLHAAEAHGIVLDVAEVFIVEEDTDLDSFRPAFECAASLGMAFANLLVRRVDENRLGEVLAKFAGIAKEYGLRPMLEFTATTMVQSMTAALDAIESSRCPYFCLEIDSLHLVRSGGRPSDLANVDPKWIGRAQLSDGPLVSNLAPRIEAVHQRQLPGHGEFPLEDFVRSLPDGITLGVEVPLRDLMHKGMPAAERARLAVEATRSVLARASNR